MTSPHPSLQLRFASDQRRRRPDWPRAFRALRALLQDAHRVELAFEISLALEPDRVARDLSQLLSTQDGRRVFRERTSLLAALSDRATLERMPEDSLGRAYLAHIDRHGLEPGKLVELGRRTTARSDDADIRWAAERGSLTHDLWHVLTGYGADPFGEGTLLAFSLAQCGGRANWLLTLGASARLTLELGPSWLPYVWKSWRRGRRAVCLRALPYEELLLLPLADVRRALRIEAPEVAHPGGVLRGEMTEA